MMSTTFDKLLYMDIREGNIVSTEEKRLTLAYEGLTDVPKNLIQDYGGIVEILDLSHNKLTSVNFLTSFKKLTTLILDHNYMTAEAAFPSNSNLTTLWLNHNFIDKLHPFVQRLGKSFPNLKFLSLMGNTGAPSYLNGGTYYEYIQYRLFVISWIPQLQYLDDRVITDDQRSEALRLYGRPFYKVLLEEQLPEFMERLRFKFRNMSFGKTGQPLGEEHECSEISSHPRGSGFSNNITSIPCNPQPVQLNSSDSESSINSSTRQRQRNLVI
ncbi:Leucine-rich repeat-containing protein C10orf11 [Orchesella cincta]|uniref:Leucine-rich repeat-containing protein C10orf11 n=1 Tax=Orchesella cincta TaxID=48709 RepID=A0A1D2NBZ6_ORCCI|nr:Leucine-rich repeat-containing protein C10orf11 [Orchesella cincta]